MQLQLIFDRTIAAEHELKALNLQIREALKQSNQYQGVLTEMQSIREKKKKVENAIKDEFSSELSKMDILKNDLQNDKMLLSDSALSSYIKGEKIEVSDKNGFKYEPVFTVKFKKLN